MRLKVLKNGFEKNLEMPAKKGDVGYDMRAATFKIIGNIFSDNYDSILDYDYLSIDYIEYETGIALEPFWRNKEECYGGDGYDDNFEYGDLIDISKYVQVKPRSSLSNYNLALCNSVATIDPNFRGTIKCRFKYLWQPEDLNIGRFVVGKINKDKIYKVGDKIAQVVFAQVIHPEIEYVDKLSESDRNTGEFGSTGK